MYYKGYTIKLSYVADISGYDYEFTHENYDGAPDSDTRHLCGFADSVEDAKKQIDEMEK